MKVELTVALDIPGAEKFSDAELRQAIFDSYTNYVACQHLSEVVEWTVLKSKYETDDLPLGAENAARIINIHRTWADIASAAEIVRVERKDTE